MKHIDIEATQRRRYENYEKEQDNLIITKVDGGYKVNNLGKASEYSVTKDSEGNIICDCKDFTNFKGAIKCKHVITVLKKAVRINNNVNVNKTKINKEENVMKANENKQENKTISLEEVNNTLQEALSRPFPQELIRHREGQKKKQLAYVETVYYIDRLNEAFGHKWNWEILSETITEHEVFCKGKLTVEIEGKTVIKEAYGGKDIMIVDIFDKQTRQIAGKKPFSIADDLKSASSDALKKACSLLGIGAHLYKSIQGNISATAPKTPITPSSKMPAPISTVKSVNTTATTTAYPPTTQPVGSGSKSPGGNGNNGGNGKGGKDIRTIIDRW